MDSRFMQVALEKGWEGVRNGQEPFGACVVKNGEIISVSHNTVNKDLDITAHAEIKGWFPKDQQKEKFDEFEKALVEILPMVFKEQSFICPQCNINLRNEKFDGHRLRLLSASEIENRLSDKDSKRNYPETYHFLSKLDQNNDMMKIECPYCGFEHDYVLSLMVRSV